MSAELPFIILSVMFELFKEIFLFFTTKEVFKNVDKCLDVAIGCLRNTFLFEFS